MTRLEELIYRESADETLAFRPTQYYRHDHEVLLKDVMAMANAPAEGRRLIVVGVRDQGKGARQLIGIAAEAFVDRKVYRCLARDFVEPPLELDYLRYELDGIQLGLLVVPEGTDRPYVMKRDFSPGLRAGDAWIRHGRRQTRLGRAQMEAIYAEKFAATAVHGEIQVGFPGAVPQTELELEVRCFDRAPSQLAAEKIRAALAARQRADAILGPDDTSIGRLMHAQQFSSDVPYEARGADTLRQNLRDVPRMLRQEDLHYRFEEQAHRVNLCLYVGGTQSLRDASIVLEMPRMKGAAVADRLHFSPAGGPARDPAQARPTYPTVHYLPERIRIAEHIGDVPHHLLRTVFAEPLRLALSARVQGRTLPLTYRLYGRNLREPVAGTLHIRAMAS